MAEQLPGAGGHGQDRPARTPVAQGGPGTERVLDTSAGTWSGWTGFWLHPLPPTHTHKVPGADAVWAPISVLPRGRKRRGLSLAGGQS